MVIGILELQPEAQKKAHIEAAKQGKIHVGMSKDIKNKTAYADLKALQIKTVSFVAYILRSFVPTLRPFQQVIADAVVSLMKDCPVESCGSRKVHFISKSLGTLGGYPAHLVYRFPFLFYHSR